jgi:hypothetical protein
MKDGANTLEELKLTKINHHTTLFLHFDAGLANKFVNMFDQMGSPADVSNDGSEKR